MSVEAPAAILDFPPLNETHPALTRRFTLALTVLLGCFAGLGPLAIDMYLPSFPAIAREFGVSNAQVERTLTAYLFGLALGQLFYGPAADRWGRKKPLYVGLTLFTVASFGCAFATNVKWLLLLRTFQAFGGCAEMVIARAIVRDLFDDRTAVGVFSSLMLVMGVAPVVAPMLGGVLVTYVGWRGVFWTLVLAGSICFAGATLLLPESLPPERRQKHSIGTTIKIYRRLLTHRIFIVHTLTVSLGCAALFAYVGGSPDLFIKTFHVPEKHFWMFFSPNVVALIGMSQVNGRLAHKVDPRILLRNALTVALVAALCLLFFVFTGVGGMWSVCACLFVFMGTFGFIFPNTTVLAMSPHGANAGNASALLGCFQFLISAIGGIIVTNLPTTGPRAMAIVIASSIGLIPIVRAIGRLHHADAPSAA